MINRAAAPSFISLNSHTSSLSSPFSLPLQIGIVSPGRQDHSFVALRLARVLSGRIARLPEFFSRFSVSRNRELIPFFLHPFSNP